MFLRCHRIASRNFAGAIVPGRIGDRIIADRCAAPRANDAGPARAAQTDDVLKLQQVPVER